MLISAGYETLSPNYIGSRSSLTIKGSHMTNLEADVPLMWQYDSAGRRRWAALWQPSFHCPVRISAWDFSWWAQSHQHNEKQICTLPDMNWMTPKLSCQVHKFLHFSWAYTFNMKKTHQQLICPRPPHRSVACTMELAWRMACSIKQEIGFCYLFLPYWRWWLSLQLLIHVQLT